MRRLRSEWSTKAEAMMSTIDYSQLKSGWFGKKAVSRRPNTAWHSKEIEYEHLLKRRGEILWILHWARTRDD